MKHNYTLRTRCDSTDYGDLGPPSELPQELMETPLEPVHTQTDTGSSSRTARHTRSVYDTSYLIAHPLYDRSQAIDYPDPYVPPVSALLFYATPDHAV